MEYLIPILSGIVGLAVGIIVMMVMSRAGLNKAKEQAKQVITEATDKAENITREAALDARMQVYEMKLAAEKEIKEKKQEAQKLDAKLMRREDTLNFRDEVLTNKEKQFEEKNKKLTENLMYWKRWKKILSIKRLNF